MKLWRIVQGSWVVDQYFKEMEMLIQWENVDVDDENTMTRFVDGFNKPIVITLRLETYIDLDETIHKAIEIEQQLSHRVGSNALGVIFTSM